MGRSRDKPRLRRLSPKGFGVAGEVADFAAHRHATACHFTAAFLRCFDGLSMNRRLLPRLLLTPAMATLFLWMIVPLVMTIYFSLIRYNLMQPDQTGFAGLENFEFFITDPSFGFPPVCVRYNSPAARSIR